MSHFYTHEGEPRHEQPTKKGAKNPTRPTRISDAVAQGLLEGVSTITGTWANPGLVRYKIMQAARCAFRSPPFRLDTEEEYVAKIYADSQRDAARAADVGTIIHKALENHYTGTEFMDTLIELGGVPYSLKELIRPAIVAVDGLGIDIQQAEKVLVNKEHGYAGTTDIIWRKTVALGQHTVMLCNRGILDFKSKRTEPGAQVKPNQDHALQIAAYHMAEYGYIDEGTDLGYNVYISTTEPGRVEIKEWSAEELASAWEAFQHCLALRRYQTGYDPRTT